MYCEQVYYVPTILCIIISCAVLHKKRKRLLSLGANFVCSLGSKFSRKQSNYRIPGTNCMRIPVNNGSLITLPFDENKEFDMCMYTVCGTDHKDKEHDLTNLAGVPYNFSPNDLGMKNITVTNHASMDSKIFEADEVIGYPDI